MFCSSLHFIVKTYAWFYFTNDCFSSGCFHAIATYTPAEVLEDETHLVLLFYPYHHLLRYFFLSQNFTAQVLHFLPIGYNPL